MECEPGPASMPFVVQPLSPYPRPHVVFFRFHLTILQKYKTQNPTKHRNEKRKPGSNWEPSSNELFCKFVSDQYFPESVTWRLFLFHYMIDSIPSSRDCPNIENRHGVFFWFCLSILRNRLAMLSGNGAPLIDKKFQSVNISWFIGFFVSSCLRFFVSWFQSFKDL